MIPFFRMLAACLALTLATAAPAFPAETGMIKIVAFGDSLVAGYGLPVGQAFTARLQAALRARGHAVEIVNAGNSGDTVDDGLARLDWSIPADADAVIVEFGANDALRGLDPAATRTGLDELVGRLAARSVPVLVAGMVAPRNLGPRYTAAFDPIFAQVAKKHGALFYPFFLDGVATTARLNQPDGIHPNAAGVAVIVERILPSVESLIAQVKAKRS